MIGIMRKRIWHGITFKRNNSFNSLPIFGFVQVKTATSFSYCSNRQKNDFILCQITSKNYGDLNSFKLVEKDFEIGSLQKTSFVRYTKIFTANNTIISSEFGKLKVKKFNEIIELLIKFLKD